MITSAVVANIHETHRTPPASGLVVDARAEVDCEHPAARRLLLQDLQIAAKCDVPVLISGESISNAERLALWIHRRSARRDAPFLVLDAALFDLQAALVDSLRDALGPGAQRDDLVRKARGGTLFMPHIENMPPAMQVALLHFLELPELRRRASLRLIAAADRCAFERVHTGQFSANLYYRLNVIHISRPAGRRDGSRACNRRDRDRQGLECAHQCARTRSENHHSAANANQVPNKKRA
jgi:DNA-binding NtrC family response regulator